MRRLNDEDVQSVNEAVVQIDHATASLKEIDLRQYAGDPEAQEMLREARNDLKVARGRLREVRGLKWRR